MNVMGPENASKTSDFFMDAPAARPPAMQGDACGQPLLCSAKANYAARHTATVKSELFAGL
jgi:hypothetical protein